MFLTRDNTWQKLKRRNVIFFWFLTFIFSENLLYVFFLLLTSELEHKYINQPILIGVGKIVFFEGIFMSFNLVFIDVEICLKLSVNDIKFSTLQLNFKSFRLISHLLSCNLSSVFYMKSKFTTRVSYIFYMKILL